MDSLPSPMRVMAVTWEIMQYLAMEGSSFTVRTTGNSPIHIASEEGYLDIVKWLMERGVAADVYDDTGKTPFLYACFHGTSLFI